MLKNTIMEKSADYEQKIKELKQQLQINQDK